METALGRWDIDDVRSPGSSSPSAPEREVEARPPAPTIRWLPDQLPDRMRDQRGQHVLTLPSGPDREPVRNDGRLYNLRGSEVDLLEKAGQYRHVFTDDLRRDSCDSARFHADLRSLERQGLIEERPVTRMRDGTTADVVSVTGRGQQLLDHHRDPDHDAGQSYYGGWVKPSEIWHDASLFRMCRTVEAELARDGAEIRRVILDDELKADAYRALNASDGSEDAREAIARAQSLHLEHGHFVFPDVRLEIEDADGRSRTMDLELVTDDYHRGHIGGKARAGFTMFRAGSAGRRGGVPYGDPIERLLR